MDKIQAGFERRQPESGKPLTKYQQDLMDNAKAEKGSCVICRGRGWVVDPDVFGELKPCRCGKVTGGHRDYYATRTNFPRHPPRTFAQFELRPGTAKAVEAAKAFAAGSGPAIVTLVGEKGAGKSHLLEAVGRAVAKDGAETVRYQVVPDLLYDMRRAIGDHTGTTEAEAMCNAADVLLLDDLGAEKHSEWVEEVLYRIVNDRYSNNRRLMVTTNLDIGHLAAKVGSRVADRVWDYKTGDALQVVMTAPSFRTGETWDQK